MTTEAPPRVPGLGSSAGLVFLGGFVGTTARYAVALALPVAGGWPLATLAVNLTGAFLLALLLGRLAAWGSADAVRLRLLLGTGVISGYTTYSTLAVETERLLATGSTGTALGYVAVTLVGGILAVVAGHALASRGVVSEGER